MAIIDLGDKKLPKPRVRGDDAQVIGGKTKATVDTKIIYDENGVARVLIGFQESGF